MKGFVDPDGEIARKRREALGEAPNRAATLEDFRRFAWVGVVLVTAAGMAFLAPALALSYIAVTFACVALGTFANRTVRFFDDGARREGLVLVPPWVGASIGALVFAGLLAIDWDLTASLGPAIAGLALGLITLRILLGMFLFRDHD